MTNTLRKRPQNTPKDVRLYSVKSLENVQKSKNRSKSWELSLEEFKIKNPELDDKYFFFVNNVLKTDATRAGYMCKMKYFVNWSELQSTGDLIEMKDSQKIEDLLRVFLGHLKTRDTTGATQRQYVTSIIQFLSECRIKVDGRFITRIISKHTPQKIQSWTRKDIQKMLRTLYGNKPKYRAMILMYASSGMRREGLTELKFGNLKPIEDFYEITVYAGEPEEYTTYCTPEAREAIDEYLNTRRDGKEYTSNCPTGTGSTKRVTKRLTSETIGKDSYVFTNEFKQNRKLGSGIVSTTFIDIVKKAGLNGQKNKHAIHSFRHTFQTALTNEMVIGKDGNEYPAIPIVRQRQLMGHKITTNDLQNLYTDVNQDNLVKEYKKVIPALTFCKEAILEKENIDLREKVTNPEIQVSAEIEELKAQMIQREAKMLEQIAELTNKLSQFTLANAYEEEVENSLVRSRKGSKKLVPTYDPDLDPNSKTYSKY